MLVKEYSNLLKNVGCTHSFNRKEEYANQLDRVKWYETFPWREEQRKIINAFEKQERRMICVNALFGSGKTTILLGLLIKGLFENKYKYSEILFTAFNLSVRNEIRKKLSSWGIKNKIKVRTFDSLIYEICKHTEYEYIDLPHFEGKRKHTYDLKGDEYDGFHKYKYVFVDEAQDLEKQTLSVFTSFFPNAQFIFVGDIFQSIQKEPRESLLWYTMTNDTVEQDCHRIFMKETPRVPRKILVELKAALCGFYPDMKPIVENWKSTNTLSDESIDWHRYYSWNDIHKTILDFCKTYSHESIMILTFSSAITVKGALGDLARIRTFLRKNGIDVNKNHKSKEDGKVFLSTSNSSKGLERDNVLVILTFPLELAFINFSTDLTMNLTTVAFSRAKRYLKILVPAYKDKFSLALKYYSNSLKPNKERIREGVSLEEKQLGDYLTSSTNVTEFLRQSIIKYDTRIKLNELTKLYKIEKFGDDAILRNRPSLSTDEERVAVGVLVENLITGMWLNKFPKIPDVSNIEHNPMYIHCIAKIRDMIKEYTVFKKGHNFKSSFFEGMYLYSKIHIAISHKLFIDIPREQIEIKLKAFWNDIKDTVMRHKPTGEFDVQCELRLPFLTGIADTISKDKETGETTLYEIKASHSSDWEKDALIQAICYVLMTAKTRCRIVLLNPFTNTMLFYSYRGVEINQIRHYLMYDVAIWNLNCYLTKSVKMDKLKSEKREIDIDNRFLLIRKDKVISKTTKKAKTVITQAVGLRLFSPTKCIIDFIAFNGEIGKKQGALEEREYEFKDEKNVCTSVVKQCNESTTKLKNINKIIKEYKAKHKVIDIIDYYENLEGEITTNIKEIVTEKLNFQEKEDAYFNYEFGDVLFDSVVWLSLLSRYVNFVYA